MLEESEDKEDENFNLYLSNDEEIEDLLPSNNNLPDENTQYHLHTKNCVNRRNY